MTRICVVVSSMYTVRVFLMDHLTHLSKRYQVEVVANTSDRTFLRNLGVPCDVISAPIERPIRPIRDGKALLILRRLFRDRGYAAVHSVTPKAGLLSMTAARLARVPVRIHTFTGQVWATRAGPMRSLLRAADRTTAAMATHVLADSPSQRDFLLREGVVSAEKSTVLAHGSISGVDLDRFRPDPEARARLRAEMRIPETSPVFLHLGRLKRDKGSLVMAQAFARYAQHHAEAHLIMVGPDEEGLRPSIQATCNACHDRIHFEDFTDVPERYMAAADVFCLPSYREGFGTSIIEAAAAGIPSLASRIYGCIDAVEDGHTGFLHEPGDVTGLVELMALLTRDPTLRRRLGAQGRERATRLFAKDRVTSALLDYYERVLHGMTTG